jgi:cardiolipin synthase
VERLRGWLLASGAKLPSRASLRRVARRVALGAVQAAVGLVAIVGLLFLTRGTAVHRVRAIGGEGAPVAPVEPAFPMTVAVLVGTPMADGNRIEIALDGDGTFPRLWTDLRSARRSITVQLYYAASGRVADTARRHTPGAGRVRPAWPWLLYDAFGSALPDRT